MEDRVFVLATIFVVAIIVLVVLVGALVFRLITTANEENGLTLVERAVNVIFNVLRSLDRPANPSETAALNNAAMFAVNQINDVTGQPQEQAHTHPGAAPHAHAPGAQPVQPAGAAQPVAGQPVVGQVQITITGQNLGVAVDGNQVVQPPHH